jgi:hypothetical protein
LFCSRAAETSTPDGKLSACRRCCRERLIDFLKSALSEAELRELILGDQADAGPAEPQQGAWQGKMERLLSSARRSGAPALLPVGELSRGLGRPAARRRAMTPAEQRLALARAEARQQGQVLPVDVAASVRRAGLRA